MSHVTANYTTHCRDAVSGQVGCFLFDTEHWQASGEFKAISPVFPSLIEFYVWDEENGGHAANVHLEREDGPADIHDTQTVPDRPRG